MTKQAPVLAILMAIACACGTLCPPGQIPCGPQRRCTDWRACQVCLKDCPRGTTCVKDECVPCPVPSCPDGRHLDDQGCACVCDEPAPPCPVDSYLDGELCACLCNDTRRPPCGANGGSVIECCSHTACCPMFDGIADEHCCAGATLCCPDGECPAADGECHQRNCDPGESQCLGSGDCCPSGTRCEVVFLLGETCVPD
jgi:hypothetical protein